MLLFFKIQGLNLSTKSKLLIFPKWSQFVSIETPVNFFSLIKKSHISLNENYKASDEDLNYLKKNFVGGRVIDDFINLKDFAPTFLELAKINIPEEMNANSFYDILISKDQGKVNEDRNSVIMARERHAFVRQGGKGYPGRAIRTEKFLYIRNYTPERWPAGDPPLYGDVDAHMLHYDAPTKIYILKNKLEKEIKPFFDLAFVLFEYFTCNNVRC